MFATNKSHRVIRIVDHGVSKEIVLKPFVQHSNGISFSCSDDEISFSLSNKEAAEFAVGQIYQQQFIRVVG